MDAMLTLGVVCQGLEVSTRENRSKQLDCSERAARWLVLTLFDELRERGVHGRRNTPRIKLHAISIRGPVSKTDQLSQA